MKNIIKISAFLIVTVVVYNTLIITGDELAPSDNYSELYKVS